MWFSGLYVFFSFVFSINNLVPLVDVDYKRTMLKG